MLALEQSAKVAF